MKRKKFISYLVSLTFSLTLVNVVTTSASATEVGSASQMPGTNHYYVYYSNAVSWQNAYDTARTLTFQGATGHLANITSAEENSFISGLGGRGWIGAKRDASQTFRWADGPESGVALTYGPWCPGEPNNWGGGEPYAEASGCWNDNGGHGEAFGFYVEFEPKLEPGEVQTANQMPGTGHYYKYFSYSMSWDDAKDYASKLSYQGMSGHLATVTSSDENSFIASLGGRGWLGAKRDENYVFRWAVGPEAGQLLNYTSWYPGEPNCRTCEFYLETNIGEGPGYWNDVNPPRGFYVEFEPDPTPLALSGSGHFYQFFGGEYTWDTANLIAKSKSYQGLPGHLVTITSQAENDFVQEISANKKIWLGAGKIAGAGNNFEWLVGPEAGSRITSCSGSRASCINTSLYSNWDPDYSQPDLVGEDKISMWRSGMWHDVMNTYGFGFVIEYEFSEITKPELTGLAITGRTLQLNPGTYPTGSVVSIPEWQISANGTSWTAISASSPAFAGDSTLMQYRILESDESKFLRAKVTVTYGGQNYVYYSTAIEARKSLPMLQQKSTLGYDTLCVIQQGNNKLRCQGPKVPNWEDEFQSVDASVNALCATTFGGKVRCFDYANGLQSFRYTGVQDEAGYVDGLSGVVEVKNGYTHTCSLTVSGLVYCWGNGNWGPLGPNSPGISANPVAIPGLDQVVQIDTGWDHNCALTLKGEVYCWGNNQWGQIGQGYTSDRIPTPTKVSGISHATSISVERWHSCATTSDGKVWCWGDNTWAESGNGVNGGSYSSPVQVSSITNAKQVYSGSDYNCAITIENRVYCWGANNVGQSNPAITNSDRLSVPSLLAITDVGSLVVGHGETCALLLSGQSSCWGANQFGPQRIPDPNYLYQLNVNTYSPTNPTVAGVTVDSGTLNVSLSPASMKTGVSYYLRVSDDSASCLVNATGVCTLSGLTNYKYYELQYRAASNTGLTSWQKVTKQYMPHTPGLQILLENNNVKLNELTKITILDAAVNSTIWVRVGTLPKFSITTDENGSASTVVWLTKSSSAKIAVTSGKTTVSKTIYSPKLVQLSTVVKAGKSAKVIVQYALPGSTVQVSLSDGRKISAIAGSTVNTTVLIPFTTKGLVTYSVTVDGKDLGNGAVVVF